MLQERSTSGGQLPVPNTGIRYRSQSIHFDPLKQDAAPKRLVPRSSAKGGSTGVGLLLAVGTVGKVDSAHSSGLCPFP